MEKIKINEKTTVFATGKNNHCPEGRELIVHPIAAAKLIERGYATAGKIANEPKASANEPKAPAKEPKA
jgi:hypothetical protein